MPRVTRSMSRQRERGRRSFRGRGRLIGRVTQTASNSVQFMRLMRIIIASLPLDDGLQSLFDVIFNYIIKQVTGQKEAVDYFTGAYCIFKITPGILLSMSPLLAESADGYSFPGYPVSVRYVGMTIVNTSKMSEKSGRWAAVFIPYREIHDDKNIPATLQKLTFQQVCAMPHAISAPANVALKIHFKMRDRTMYCARPRELTEPIGICAVFWDTSRDKDIMKKSFDNSLFSCEINMYAGCLPHVIFGPDHRKNYPASTFTIPTLTNGEARIHQEDGNVLFAKYDEYLKVREERKRIAALEEGMRDCETK